MNSIIINKFSQYFNVKIFMNQNKIKLFLLYNYWTVFAAD